MMISRNRQIVRCPAARGRAARVSCAVLATALASLALAATAFASYEQAAEFGDTGPVIGGSLSQLTGASGAAVNYTGVGGAAPGTLYVARELGTFSAAARGLRVYGPKGEFLEEWGDIGHPYGVAVDQATGNVYVLRRLENGEFDAGQKNEVLVYSPTGNLITSFGERGVFGESVDEGPAKIHGVAHSGIAVDEAGTVYVSDTTSAANFERRVMVFKPQSAGDYEHYVYAGRAADIAYSTGSTPEYYTPRGLSIDAAGNLYMSVEPTDGAIYEFDPSQPETPICSFKVPGGGQTGMTADPITGEVFYISEKHNLEIKQLNACNSGGKFTVKGAIPLSRKAEGQVWALAIDPVLRYSPSRPVGMLYMIVPQPEAHAYGVILAGAEFHLPAVESESVLGVGATTASLGSQVNPQGFPTRYTFQYLTEAAYESNHPDEVQSLTISATSGLFGIAAAGRRYGGEVSATLTSGSTAATALVTAKGTATLKAAKGTATLKAAIGTGTLISGSSAITAVATSAGAFEVGQSISGDGIPSGAKISTVKAGELTISSPATKSQANASLSAGQVKLTSLATSEGAFEVGQRVKGEGISSETTITAVSGTELTLSAPATKAGVGVAIQAGSAILTSLATSEGAFETGQRVEGVGIPAGTTIKSVNATELILSQPAEKAGVSVAINSAGPLPLAAGQSVEGPGVAPGTTIASVNPGGLTLSQPAVSSGAAVHLRAGLPFDVSDLQLREALASLPAIGAGNLSVTGGPGDESGSSPYAIEFTGALANTDVAQIEASSLGLGGGPASVAVATVNQGGGGFAGAAEAPPGGANMPSGNKALSVSTSLTGLAPDSAYRFRALATSHCNPDDEEEACTAVGAPESFRTFPAAVPGLPDHRAWEMVSPARKNGGEVFPAFATKFSYCQFCKPGLGQPHFPMQSAPDGESVVFEGSPFSSEEGNGKFEQYISRRGPSGWQTRNLTPALMSPVNGYQGFDPGLSAGVLLQANTGATLGSGAPNGYANLYAQATGVPTPPVPLLSAAPPNRTTSELKVGFAGGSADFSKLFFSANDALTGETPFAPAAADGGASKSNLYQSAGGQLALVNVLPGNAGTVPGQFGSGERLNPNPNGAGSDFSHAVSNDGSRVFWSNQAGQVYVREDGERTREISDHVGLFLTASADGSRVLLNDGCLYILASEACEDLTQGKGGFQGIAGQSEDLSHVYFVDTAVLTGEEENGYGATATAGEYNLYAWANEDVTFVATFAVKDRGGQTEGNWVALPQLRTAEASPNGRWVAFRSVAPLTGQDNTGACLRAAPGSEEFLQAPCAEIFLYDSVSDRLVCASCNPSGKAPLGASYLGLIEGGPSAAAQPRYMLDSGRLYFDSGDSLSQFDTNEGIEDVYQYEPGGTGTCARAGGCVDLVSAGREPVDSNFISADESGRNVFFTTRDRLSQRDTDELLDLYDAREGGGFAAETETQRVECQGEACQPPASVPNDPTPASSSFQGAGNVVPAKAKKQKPKHHKKKHHKKKKQQHHRRANNDRRGSK